MEIDLKKIDSEEILELYEKTKEFVDFLEDEEDQYRKESGNNE